jgi:hypothetical protein
MYNLHPILHYSVYVSDILTNISELYYFDLITNVCIVFRNYIPSH